MTKLRWIFLPFCPLLLVGCINTAQEPLQPWQRGIVSKPEMGFSSRPLQRQLQQHIYFSKEAAHGQPAVADGGCGCN